MGHHLDTVTLAIVRVLSVMKYFNCLLDPESDWFDGLSWQEDENDAGYYVSDPVTHVTSAPERSDGEETVRVGTRGRKKRGVGE